MVFKYEQYMISKGKYTVVDCTQYGILVNVKHLGASLSYYT